MDREINVTLQREQLSALTKTLIFAEGCAQMMGPACLDIYLESMELRDVLYYAAAKSESEVGNENRTFSGR